MNELNWQTLFMWAFGGLFTVTWALLGWLKSVYDQKIRDSYAETQKVRDMLDASRRDADSTHINISSQTQLVSERVTRLEGAITATLASVQERLVRIEGLLDAMMRAGFGQRNAS